MRAWSDHQRVPCQIAAENTARKRQVPPQKASNTADQEQTRRTFPIEHFESEIACQNQKNALYIFPLTESTRAGQPGEEKLWLFEPFLITTRASRERREIFFI
jgi:hypothetical protein